MMAEDKAIQLPEKTRGVLVELVKERQRIEAEINRVVTTAQDCLGVPQGWRMRDVMVGFEPEQDGLAN